LAHRNLQFRHADRQVSFNVSRILFLLGYGVANNGKPVTGSEEQIRINWRLDRFIFFKERVIRFGLWLLGNAAMNQRHAPKYVEKE